MNVLVLQGGGMLGYGQALILAELEKRSGKLSADLFQLVAGCSVGSIIGACVAARVPAASILDFFVKDGPQIFHSTWLDSIEALDGPKYNPGALEAALMAVLSNRTLKDCDIRFMAPAYDFKTDKIVRYDSGCTSYSDENHIVIGNDSPVELWQICRASSAAQTYFPAYQMDGMTLLDGGNTSDNAPDMMALAEIIAMGYPLSNVRMLSLGSGDTVWNVNADAMVKPSPIRAGLETIKIVFSAGEDAQVSKARKILGPGYFRLKPNLGTEIGIDDAHGCLTQIPPAVEKLISANGATLDEFCPVKPAQDESDAEVQ